jgi:aryl-alcohol dehydrogenase-like predicted oxidoreductase
LAEIMRTGRVDCIQVPYNVLERDVEEEILPLAQDMGIGVIVMRPVGRGVLVRGLKTQPDLSPLKEYGIETWGQAALAWLLSDSRISLVIPATSRHQRISENAAAGSAIIPAELREYISSEAKRCL